jgi:hypothetical protein
MKILQQPISVNHKSAMFFDGLVAECDGNKLTTYNDGEINFMGNIHVGKELIDLGQKELINDDDIEKETVDILVDKFFMINDNEDMLYDNYDEAIQAFETFLNKKS